MLRRDDQLTTAAHPFAISRRDLGERTTVVSIEGELDLWSAPRMKWVLVEALQGGNTRLVVDLAGVTFMDSMALAVLVSVNRRLDASGRLAIVCDRSELLRIFELSGTDGVFEVHATLDDALTYVRGEIARTG